MSRTANKPKQDATANHLNDGIDLSEFNYKEMRGDMFNKYIDLTEGRVLDEEDPHERRGGGLDRSAKYKFDVYKVEAVYARLYPKSQVDLTKILKGFTLVKDAPIRETICELKDAIELNMQLKGKHATGNQRAPQYEYYLLQQPKTVQA